MANQEFPMFALHRGATLLGDAMVPRTPCGEHVGRDGSRPAPPKRKTLNVLDRLDAWFWRCRRSEHEAYLAQSHDVFDLERRMRARERGIGG